MHPDTVAVPSILARWKSNPRIAPNLTCVRELPAEPARFVDIPAHLHPRLVAALWDRGITRLYSHQAQALEAEHRGKDVVVATPTASGKSLCYHLPVLDALLADPAARALYLFPTKALARDQVEAARELARACRVPDLGVAVYDGDTPPDQRRAARSRARILVTNPDMLHAGILPHHADWAALLAGLTHVVVDELHVYRGVFGAGVANVLRRLRRIAEFHGSRPRFVATSATIANPDELATRVLGSSPDDLHVIRESGAPVGQRTFVIYNPPVVDAALGLRASYLKATKRLTRDLIDAGVGSLVFARSRRTVEILVRYLRDSVDEDPVASLDPDEAIRGYRGGYLPGRRREVERVLRDGETSCVVATSALELGIDVGGLDAVVLAGWPGSRAATWQRAGRAGRRGAPALVVMVSSSEPLDQYVAGDPDFLFGEPPEHGRVDPDNHGVVMAHLRCAAFELPFAPGEGFGPWDGNLTREALRQLAGARLVYEDPNEGSFHWIADAYPAQGVPLRGQIEENYAVIDLASGSVVAEVDFRDAPRQLFPNAIYALEGRLHQVERLDDAAHKAYVRAIDVDYTTEAMTYTRVRPIDVLAVDPAGLTAHGEVHVVDKVVGFKKIKLHTHENVGYGEVTLPEQETHARSLWFDVPRSDASGAPIGLDAARRAAYALHHMAALVVMGETGDLGRAVAVPENGEPPRVYLYDRAPGGTGVVERLFDERQTLVERALKRVERCACTAGCPACVGALGEHGGAAKAGALRLLGALAAGLLGARGVGACA